MIWGEFHQRLLSVKFSLAKYLKLKTSKRIPPTLFDYLKTYFFKLGKSTHCVNLNARAKLNVACFASQWRKSKIHFWLTDWNMITQISSCDIRPAAIESTDHMAISIKIKIPCKRGPGYWKFNNTLLNNKLYTKQVEIILNNFKYLQADHKCKWELCKIDIKQI